ncbi:MAG: type II toxin-antitoxin system RelB/DinJ family antitoxin [Campylobacteraceae bacterium]
MKVKTTIKLDKEYRDIASDVFEQYGMSFSEGINLICKKIAKAKVIPFEFEPSDRLKKALKEVEEGKVKRFSTFEAFKKELYS